MGFLLDWMLPAALAIMMFSLGISLTLDDFSRVAKHPKAFAVGAFAQMLLLPAFSFAVGLAFGLPPELALGLFILALCPGGPTSNYFSRLAKGDVALSISLTAVITIISIFSVPVFAAFAGDHFLGNQGRSVSVFPIAIRAIIVMLIPISFGIFLRRQAPLWVAKNEKVISILAIILVAAVILGSVVTQWKNFVMWFSTMALACFTVMAGMMAAGLLLGKVFGLSQAETSAISIDTAMQNAVMGITIGAMFAATQGQLSLVSVPSGMYGVLMYFVCLPFVFWRRYKVG